MIGLVFALGILLGAATFAGGWILCIHVYVKPRQKELDAIIRGGSDAMAKYIRLSQEMESRR